MFHSSNNSVSSTVQDEVMRHQTHQTNEETIVRLGHEVAGLQTTLQGNQDAFEKQMSYLESTTAADEAETKRLQRLLDRSEACGATQWVPDSMFQAYEEERNVKTEACEEYQKMCNLLLGGIAAEIAGGGSGAEAVLDSLRQALQDHGFGNALSGSNDTTTEGGSSSTAAALLATLLPPEDPLL